MELYFSRVRLSPLRFFIFYSSPFIVCALAQGNWEIAVVTDKKLELLDSNGMLVGSTINLTAELKTLAFDNARSQFIVSDRVSQNDSIFSVLLTNLQKAPPVNETKVTPLVTNLPDDVQGLAVDPIEDVVYWTDQDRQTINYLKLNDTDPKPQVLLYFNNSGVRPRGITIDVCGRYIYWTNSFLSRPTIERAFLNGSNREVIIDTDLKMPSGIAIDYRNNRLYWVDMGEGIYNKIESSRLDGKEREMVYNGTHTKPFGIAVDDSSVYWTDIINNAIWRLEKTFRTNSSPRKIRDYSHRPFGIIAKGMQVNDYPDCEKGSSSQITDNHKEEEAIEEQKRSDLTSNDIIEIQCLNGGKLAGGKCVCPADFTGQYCETEPCYNFCLHGSCHLTPMGNPTCRCRNGFSGTRCELEVCANFCLNGGTCTLQGGSSKRCYCSEHFSGDRCEISTDFTTICQIYCRDKAEDDESYLFASGEELSCRCDQASFVVTKSNLTAASLYSEASPFYGRTFMEKLSTDRDFLALALSMSFLVIIIIGLAVYHFSTRNKRPIITKRVFVNRTRNLTPLTQRPETTTERCEVTIENCCNMNVCETPCFEPPIFRSKNKEDTKVLLSEVDSGEESY